MIAGTTAGAEDGQTVTVNVGGTNYFGTVGSGAYTVTVAAADLQALPEGAIAVTADVADAAGNAAVQATAGFTRITSYNVCYTKLLRRP